MEEQLKNELGKVIEQITTSGDQVPNPKLVKEFKSICKQGGDSLIQCAFRGLMHQLDKKHCQIRYASIQLIDVLFARSHCFRSLICTQDALNDLFDLTIGVNRRRPLPAPKSYAALTKEFALQMLERWSEQFGRGYPVLQSSFCSLRELIPQMTNDNAGAASSSSSIQRTNRESDAVQKLLAEFEILTRQITKCLKRMQRGFDHLCPHSDLFEQVAIDQSNAGDDVQDNIDTRLHTRHRPFARDVEITLKPYIEIELSDENRPIVDKMQQLNNQSSIELLPKVQECLKRFSANAPAFEMQIKRCIDLKTNILKSIGAFSEIKFIEKSDQTKTTNDEADGDDEDEEEDFEEVEDFSIEQNGPEFGIILPIENALDLEITKLDVPDESSCRYRMANGRLCPRKDKVRCPFHGRIIERDEQGLAIDEEIRRQEEEERLRKENDWQDPQFLRQLESQIGIDLTVKRKVSRKRYPNLIDLKKYHETPRKRLKKILRI